MKTQRINDRIKLNSGLLHKNNVNKALKRAEESILGKISTKIQRAENQSLERRLKRLKKKTNFQIKPDKN